LHELVELRAELSKLLRSDVDECKSRLRMAQLETSAAVEPATPVTIDTELREWLSDVADADTIQKVEALHVFIVLCRCAVLSCRLLKSSCH
jgi:hypothetical protein